MQIISGKFFASTERECSEGKGILYSNFSWVAPIKTCIATIEPLCYSSSNTTPYVISYLNQIEKDGVIKRVGDNEIIHQLRLLCIFGLRAYFDFDRNNVSINCRTSPQNSNDNFIPAQFTTRFFESIINGTQEDISVFISLVKQTIGLPRATYEVVMSCMENFTNSLQAINYNLDLAYSMMIYSLEALSQSFDNDEVIWEDYDKSVANKLEKAFASLDNQKTEEIKCILLQSSHVKLQQRFINFILQNIQDSFFLEESTEKKNAIRKSELKELLKNAYNMRSKFVHQLQEIPNLMHEPCISQGEVLYLQNNAFLTYKGLSRLAYHVIKNFIFQQKTVEIEKIDWRNKLPGLVTMSLSPEYWIWKAENFESRQVFLRFSEFLTQVQELLLYNGKISNLNKLVIVMNSKIETETMPKTEKKAMLYLSLLFLAIIKDEKHNVLVEKYSCYLNECSIEKMVYDIIVKRSLTDTAECCEDEYIKYRNTKFHKNKLRIPILIELMLIIAIGNLFLAENNIEKYDFWINDSILEATGYNNIQEELKKRKNKKEAIDVDIILKMQANGHQKG